MITIEANDYIKQIKLPPGRAVAACRQIKAGALGANHAAVASRCDEAISAYTASYKLDQRWAQQGAASARREAADELNTLLDDALADAYTICQRRAGDKRNARRAEAATLLLDTLYPNGLAAVTQASYETQYLAMQVIVAALLKPDILHAAKLLGVDEDLQVVADNLDAFGEAIQRIEGISFRQVQAQRVASHNTLLEVIVAALAATYGAPTQRQELLQPLRAQSEQVTLQRTHAKPPTDLNPDTGAEEPIAPSSNGLTPI